MSEGVPKRKFLERIQVMNTDEMQSLAFANRKGQIIKLLGNDEYLVKLGNIGTPVILNGHSLRAWVEPLKGDLK